MNTTPKALRLHVGIFGRTNVGKSSFLNYISDQPAAIVSPLPGTTTDVVEKAMELLPLGPVLFLDTAGLDDVSPLAALRLDKTNKAFTRCDVVTLVTEAGVWGEFEAALAQKARAQNTKVIVVINKSDQTLPDAPFLDKVRQSGDYLLVCSTHDLAVRASVVNEYKRLLIQACPDEFTDAPVLLGDLVRPGGLAVMVVPIDLEAPKGRLILPQVQAIRDVLDSDAATLIVKEREYASVLAQLKIAPDIVVCDSQVVLKMTADTPLSVKCTTFSILFSRYRGDLVEAARAVSAIEGLRPGDRVLIAEACSHHPVQDDIGRVKIPRWLRQYAGVPLDIVTCAGTAYPDDLRDYKLVIHCGACMINRRQMLWRLQCAREAGVPVTNYGVAIAYVQGVLTRVLEPFPAATAAFKEANHVYR